MQAVVPEETEILQCVQQAIKELLSVCGFGIVSWGGGIKAGDASRLNKLIKRTSSVVRL